MSDVNETLQELMERRLREMGHRRGRGESISLREAYQRLLDKVDDHNAEAAHENKIDGLDYVPEWKVPTYEVFRRIRNGHTRITDPTAVALATMLDVEVDDVYRAAGVRPTLGRFELPPRADRLNERQRRVVMSVIDAILEAEATSNEETVPDRRLLVAARRSSTSQSTRAAGRRQDEAATRPDPEGPEFGA